MSKPDTDDNNEDDIEDSFGEGEDTMEEDDLDGLLETLPAGAAARKPSDNARRRVEEYMEMKRAAKELSDLDSFDFD